MRLASAVCLVVSLAFSPTALGQDFGPFPRLASAEARQLANAEGFRASTPPPGPVRAVAEFERSEAVVVSYSTWISPGDALPVELIRLLSEHVRVVSLHNRSSQEAQIRSAYQQAGVVMENVEFVQTDTDSPWTRDYGPFYVAGGDGRIGIVDFIYDVAGRTDDNTMPSALAGHLDVPLYTMDLVHTGGNYMTTGAGSAASTTRLTDYNDGDTARVLEQMEAYLGIDTYHIFEDPQATYIDHIDTWGKFLDVDKVLIAQATPGHPDYAALEAIAAELAETPSPWGTPYQVVRVQAPNRQPYTNSLIVNDRVYVATDGDDPDLDAAALQVYRDAMPGYTVHGVDYDGWLSTDALHCRTKEVADMGMLSVRHRPFSGDVPAPAELAFDAEIIAYSGEPLLDDALHLIWRAGDAPFDTLALARTEGDTFRATLPAPAAGTEVAYYLSASDASGRTEHFPLVGPAGPRTFRIVPPTDADAGAPLAGLRLAASPNPTSGPLTVRYALPDGGEVTLDVLDVLGRRVARLHEGTAAPGEHRAVWNTSGAPAGVYLVRLTAGGGSQELRRVTVVR